MLGLDRSDEPHYDIDPTMLETMNNVFEFIDQSGLNMAELKQVFRDYDAYYHGEIRKPDYVEEEKVRVAESYLDF